ncbi:hypothetical protein DBR43_29950 [Pedobacter sp. KBW06]|uniref:DUF922 domain-containing protein n=1 Tax=Pedobacter sp. KBW06 TaxID=2153359 RepID=UPI000F5A6F52|nr:DUF922 domain-containing protein [Pedobacter sp. KBW06]RQO66435.1 hypothetical protein DBR43_29950 [Pedobacter sp. KBW06]
MSVSLKQIYILGCSIFLAILNPQQVFSQQNNLNRITLNWGSFLKKNNSKRSYIAYTAHKTMHKYRATQRGNQLSLKFEVGVTLDSLQTFLDPDKLKSLDAQGKKALLNHEQGHSDLAIIYGRILYSRLSKGKYSIANYKNEVKSIYDSVMKELAGLNIKYDMETEHGQYEEEQQKWDLYFKKELAGKS